jgi:hypothetical protein
MYQSPSWRIEGRRGWAVLRHPGGINTLQRFATPKALIGRHRQVVAKLALARRTASPRASINVEVMISRNTAECARSSVAGSLCAMQPPRQPLSRCAARSWAPPRVSGRCGMARPVSFSSIAPVTIRRHFQVMANRVKYVMVALGVATRSLRRRDQVGSGRRGRTDSALDAAIRVPDECRNGVSTKW